MHWMWKRVRVLALATGVSSVAGDVVRDTWRHEAPQVNRAAHNQLSDAPVIIIYKPDAARTELADQAGISGVVKLRMTLNQDGAVSCIVPVETLPGGLTERAVEAAKRIKFTPAIVGGQYVDAEQLVEYAFPLPTD